MFTDFFVGSLVMSAGLIGGLMRGYSGFGFAMATVPILACIVRPDVAIPAILIYELLIALSSFQVDRGLIASETFCTLCLGSLVGTPIGILVLSKLPAEPMRICIGLILLISVIALWMLRARPWRTERAQLAGAGVLSGVLNGAMAISGPPAVLVLLGSDMDARKIRGLLIYFIAFSATIAVLLTTAVGLMNREVLSVATIMAPGVLLGTLLGGQAFQRLPMIHYRKIALIALFIIAVGSLASTILT